MTCHKCISILFGLLFLLVPRAAAFSGQGTAQAQPTNYEATARAFVAELAAEKFDTAFARFDETMAKAMPVPKLKELWQTVISQVGAYGEVKAVTAQDVGGFHVMIMSTQFERLLVDIRVVLDNQSRVAGLSFAPSKPKTNWTPPEYANRDAFEERDVTFGKTPWVLPGKLCVPKGDGPFAALVLVHGSGPNDEDESVGETKMFRDLAWGLASRNIAVLRYMKRSKQYGAQLVAIKNFTVMDETVDDARLAVEFLATQPGLDAKRIFVAGHSLGAMLAPRIAAGTPGIAGIIVMAGNTRRMEELVIEQVEYLSKLDGQVTEQEQKSIDDAHLFAKDVRDPSLKPEQTVKMLGIPLPGSYLLDLREYDPAATAVTLQIPMLILQGERDYQVRMADFEGWKKALGGKSKVTFKSFAPLNHLFMAGTGPGTPAEYSKPNHVPPEVIEEICSWVAALGGKSRPAMAP